MISLKLVSADFIPSERHKYVLDHLATFTVGKQGQWSSGQGQYHMADTCTCMHCATSFITFYCIVKVGSYGDKSCCVYLLTYIDLLKMETGNLPSRQAFYGFSILCARLFCSGYDKCQQVME